MTFTDHLRSFPIRSLLGHIRYYDLLPPARDAALTALLLLASSALEASWYSRSPGPLRGLLVGSFLIAVVTFALSFAFRGYSSTPTVSTPPNALPAEPPPPHNP